MLSSDKPLHFGSTFRARSAAVSVSGTKKEQPTSHAHAHAPTIDVLQGLIMSTQAVSS